MFEKVKAEIKKINPKSPVFLGIVGIFLAIFIYLIFIAAQTRTQQQRENTSQFYTPPAGPTPTLTPGKDFVEGQIVVKFKDGLTDAVITQELVKYKAYVKSRNSAVSTTVITVPVGQEENVRAQLVKDGLVKFAEQDYVMHAQVAPNDTSFANQWGLSNSGQNIKGQTGTAQNDIHAVAAWEVTKGSGVKVAVLDTGIDLSHPEFVGKIAIQKVFNTSSIDDQFGHGTHVAGIIAADTNNSQGIAGTCPECQLMIVKVMDDSGSGPYSLIADGITWSADNGAKVISMSIAGQSFSQLLQDAVNYAWSKGVVIVAAAGNCGGSNFSANGCTSQNPMEYPGALTNVVSVGNTDNKDQKSVTSNYGSWVKIAAPGTNIFSTLPTHTYAMQPGHGTALNYDYLTGTSMSAPMVAGVAALIWSTPYGTSNQAVVDRLYATADKIAGTGTFWQNGRVNAASAVGASTTPILITTPVPTFVCGGSPSNICGLPGTPSVTVGPTNEVTQAPSITQSPSVTGSPEISPSISPVVSPNPNPNPCSGNNGFRQSIMQWIRSLIAYIRQFIQSLFGGGKATKPARPNIPTNPCNPQGAPAPSVSPTNTPS